MGEPECCGWVPEDTEGLNAHAVCGWMPKGMSNYAYEKNKFAQAVELSRTKVIAL